ncbi:uncharacterized protein CXorf58 homolog isoform X2 [Triplophysa dalaica]|nr:uncharacterized protein CXorf58 homolog isoform X2 [Triplophysa dalaica]XP_056602362.1 uncharacterized protein CXorf58 homolog isoform X2 [Triplophysa dalaica]
MYEISAKRIQAYWRSHRNRRLFKLLVNTVRSAEGCLTPATLRQLSPREAELLKDPSLKYRLRFRFAGPHFPPSLVFKIFHIGVGGYYLSGKKLFTPSNQATADTGRMMGARTFMDFISVDEIQRQSGAITEVQDVISVKDFMQYSSHLDELPACLGGRENSWRFLSQEVLLRNITRENIKSETTGSVAAHLKKGRSWGQLTFSHFSRQQLSQRSLPVSSRRSARVKSSAARRRRLYIASEAERNQVLEEERHLDNIHNNNTDKQKSTAKKYDIKIVLPSVETEDYDDSSSESEWEEEAEKLCNWSKQLNLDDIDALECVDG